MLCVKLFEVFGLNDRFSYILRGRAATYFCLSTRDQYIDEFGRLRLGFEETGCAGQELFINFGSFYAQFQDKTENRNIFNTKVPHVLEHFQQFFFAIIKNWI